MIINLIEIIHKYLKMKSYIERTYHNKNTPLLHLFKYIKYYSAAHKILSLALSPQVTVSVGTVIIKLFHHPY